MNDDIHGRNDAILDRLDTRARYRHIEKRIIVIVLAIFAIEVAVGILIGR